MALTIRTGAMVNIETMPEGSIRIFPKTLNAFEVTAY